MIQFLTILAVVSLLIGILTIKQLINLNKFRNNYENN